MFWNNTLVFACFVQLITSPLFYFRVLAVNVVSIFWNTYLAWFAETKNKDNLNLIEQELILHEAVHESHDTQTTKSTSPTTVTESVVS